MLEELNNPIYLAAHSRFQINRNVQHEKAAEKYPSTLDPNDWTPDQLGNHLAQEVIDTLHYSECLVYLAKRGFKAEKFLVDLYEEVTNIRMIGDSPQLKQITEKMHEFFDTLKGGE